METLERLQNIEKKMLDGIASLKECVSEIYQIEGDLKRLADLLKVQILMWPDQKVYRLQDCRLREGQLIKYESDLENSISHIIEETAIENISFEQCRWEEQKEKIFNVLYKTGGYHANNNVYKNEDIGRKIFLSKQELMDVVGPLFEEAKKVYIERKEAEKAYKREALKRELENLNK